jgi:hypothetical protein
MPTKTSVPPSPSKKPPWGFFIRTVVALFMAPWLKPKEKPKPTPPESAADADEG